MPVPLFIAAALLLCAEPAPQSTPSTAPESAVIDGGHLAASYAVVASSPVPAGAGIGSHFGYRISPRTGERTFHAGLDFLVARGTPVYAAADGIVEQVAQESSGARFSGYGNAIVVHHPQDAHWSFYAHLESVEVQPGDSVHAGQLIGHVGNTTNGRFPGMGAHLHFEVRQARPGGLSPFPGLYRRHNIDPQDWLAGLGVRYDHDDLGCARAQGDDPNGPLLVLREVPALPETLAMATTH